MLLLLLGDKPRMNIPVSILSLFLKGHFYRHLSCIVCCLFNPFFVCYYRADPSIAGIPSVSSKVDESGNSNKKNESFGVDPAGQYPPVPSANGQQQSDANIVAAKSDNNPATVDDKGVWSTTELVDAILEENFKLRQQVQNHQHNIAKLQKVLKSFILLY